MVHHGFPDIIEISQAVILGEGASETRVNLALNLIDPAAGLFEQCGGIVVNLTISVDDPVDVFDDLFGVINPGHNFGKGRIELLEFSKKADLSIDSFRNPGDFPETCCLKRSLFDTC